MRARDLPKGQVATYDVPLRTIPAEWRYAAPVPWRLNPVTGRDIFLAPAESSPLTVTLTTKAPFNQTAPAP